MINMSHDRHIAEIVAGALYHVLVLTHDKIDRFDTCRPKEATPR